MEEEIWKVYKVYKITRHDYKKGDKLYFSNLGRCKLNDTIVESIPNENGYLRARSIFVHIAVATLFIPNPENKPCIDHIDGNKLNNRSDNLKWVTYSENNLNPITRKRMSISRTNISEEEKERQYLAIEYYYKNKRMKKLALILSLVLCLVSCKPIHQVVVHDVYETHVRDSVAVRDSVCYIPQEVYTNISWSYDPLHLETSFAEADCWVDSLWLKGTIRNKKAVQTQYIEVEKWRDSIVYREKPVPYPEYITVEKPLNKKLLWYSIFASIGCLGSLCWILRKQLMKLIALI